MYIILDKPHLAFFTGNSYGYVRIDPNSYKIVPRKSGAESMEQTVTGEATPPPPPLPHPTEVRPPAPPPSRHTPLPDGVTPDGYERNGDRYIPPAVDRSKTAAYLDTVSDEDEGLLQIDEQ